MSIKQQMHVCQSLNSWFNSPQGQWVLHAFMDILSPFLTMLRGEILLQAGQCGNNSGLNTLQFLHKYVASPCITNQSDHIISALDHLPFSRNAVDGILVPATLEVFKQNDNFLDELDRILKPGGYLIILGINPFSMWGFASKIGFLSNIPPKMLHLHSSFGINHKCLVRGFRQIKLINFGYIPPLESKKCLDNFFFMEEIGKMFWPIPAGFYGYIGQKMEEGYLVESPAEQASQWYQVAT